MSELRALSTMALGGAPGPEVSTLKVRGSEIQQRIAELAMEAVGEYAAPYQPGMLFQDTNETPVGPDHAPPAAPRYFNMRKTRSTAAAPRFRRTSFRRWCSGYKALHPSEARASCAEGPSLSRGEDLEEENGSVPFRRTEAAAGMRRALRSRQIHLREPPQDRRDREAAGCRRTGRSSPSSAGSACRSPKRTAAIGGGPIETDDRHGAVRQGPGARAVPADGRAGRRHDRRGRLGGAEGGAAGADDRGQEAVRLRLAGAPEPLQPRRRVAQGDQGRQRLVALGPQGRGLQRAPRPTTSSCWPAPPAARARRRASRCSSSTPRPRA